MIGISKRSGKKSIISKLFITYLVVFMVTLGFTGIIDYGEVFGPAIKLTSKAFERKKTPEKKSESKSTAEDDLTESSVSTAPITLPGPIASSTTDDTVSASVDTGQSLVAKQNTKNLAKMYSNMDSAQAASIFDNLTDKEVITLLKEMRGTASSDILAEMDSARAAKLTSKMMSEKPQNSGLAN